MTEGQKEYEYVIVGGGPATRILNHYLHMFNPQVEVAVIRDEERIANHCSIPYIIDGTVPLHEGGLTSDALVTKFGSELIKEKLISGDPERKYVKTHAGRRIGYQNLVFATGAEELVPPIPGTDLPGVLRLRNIHDFRSALDTIQDGQSFTVLGGGYVGLEVACALRRLGKHVVIVEMLPHVMGDRYDPEFAFRIEGALEDKGVCLYLGRKAIRVGGRNRVEFLEVEDGTWIETDALVMATGVKPRVAYADEFGLQTTRDGLVVDPFFQTNVRDIYALGDCVQTRSFVTERPFPGKLGSIAAQMARTLALNFNGQKIPFDGVISPACTSIFDVQFCSAGHTEKDAAQQGIAVVLGKTENTNIYSNMPHRQPLSVKLIFRKRDRRIIGGELIGSVNLAGFADCLGQLIRRGAQVEDVVAMDFSTHPEMTPNPAHSYLMFAAQEALRQWPKH